MQPKVALYPKKNYSKIKTEKEVFFMTLGEKISFLRQEKGISQEKLAELVGVSRQAVTKWENGNANPDTENLIRLAEIFGVSLDELCKGFSEKPKKISYAPGHILALFSLLVLIAYCVIGIVTENFLHHVIRCDIHQQLCAEGFLIDRCRQGYAATFGGIHTGSRCGQGFLFLGS